MHRDFDGFTRECKRVSDFVYAIENPLLAHHYDADGLSACGVVANALERAGKKYALHVLKRVDEQGIAEAERRLHEDGFGGVVFVDLGSGQNELLEKHFVEKGIACAVIDHHVPQKKILASNYAQANCMDWGFDGSTDASSASTAFYCFCSGGENDAGTGGNGGRGGGNWDLVQLALVGAVGDIQDEPALIELNAWLVKQGVEKGLVEVKKDLRLFGRVSRSLISFLRYSGEPFLPGLTGDEKACALFLDGAGIPLRSPEGKWLHYNDLDSALQRKLASALINYLLAKGVEEEVVQQIIGEVYQFPREERHSVLRDAHEYATLLNACGRHERAGLGVEVALRKPGALEQAMQVLRLHREAISKAMDFARQTTNDLGAFYFLDGRGKISDTIIGTVIGNSLNSGLLARTKPIIGFSLDEQGQVKASARATKQLVEEGVDLNEVMRGAAEAAGGLGGGHKIAAGASFPAGHEREFLRKTGETLNTQLARK